jgi:hypothetical protein
MQKTHRLPAVNVQYFFFRYTRFIGALDSDYHPRLAKVVPNSLLSE